MKMAETSIDHVVTRPCPAEILQQVAAWEHHPVLARLYAARGVVASDEVDYRLDRLLPPDSLLNMREMANIIADGMAAGHRFLVVADYDADGATACAVSVRGLQQMGAQVDYLVPNRFEFGYGLTPEIVALAAQKKPHYIITVDNGIASIAGVAAANALGIAVLVTDHHLPGEALPEARAIVNPNQQGCAFQSKHLAGVGVAFYLMLAVRSVLRNRGAFRSGAEPNLAALLDWVALGTVADVVKLDYNNRVLVEHGLRRIRSGKASAGVMALLEVSGRSYSRITAQDLAFSIGPRLNAAGRLQNMSLGIDCLLSENLSVAQHKARRLHDLNQERSQIEQGMQQEALASLALLEVGDQLSISLYRPDWHQGVIGILASRIKDRFHRPTLVFAQGESGLLKGSGRSVPGLHLRDALDMVTKRYPDLILSFGGHAMAAGLTIREADFAKVGQAFDEVVQQWVTPADLALVIETDGGLAAAEVNLALADLLTAQVWGQGFAAPEFYDYFTVIGQRVVGDKHLKLKLARGDFHFDAIIFGSTQALPDTIGAVYGVQRQEYQGQGTVQLLVRYWHAVAKAN